MKDSLVEEFLKTLREDFDDDLDGDDGLFDAVSDYEDDDGFDELYSDIDESDHDFSLLGLYDDEEFGDPAQDALNAQAISDGNGHLLDSPDGDITDSELDIDWDDDENYEPTDEEDAAAREYEEAFRRKATLDSL